MFERLDRGPVDCLPVELGDGSNSITKCVHNAYARSKVHCPHCHTEATEIRAFLLIQNSVAYCQSCGWNIGKATTKLRLDIRAMWAVAGLGVLLAVTASMRGTFGMRGAVLLAVPFVALPLSSGLVAKYRLSRIAEIQPGRPGQAVHGTTPPRQHRSLRTKILMFRWQCDRGPYISRCVGIFIPREWPWPQHSCCACCLSFCGELLVHRT